MRLHIYHHTRHTESPSCLPNDHKWSRRRNGGAAQPYDIGLMLTFGQTQQTSTIAAQASVPRKDMAIVIAMWNVSAAVDYLDQCEC